MKTNTFLIKIVGLMLAAIFVCELTLTAQEKIMVEHRRGETQVTKNPKRVVILDMGSLETYHELGIPVVGGPNNVPAYLTGFTDRNPGYTGIGSVAKADVAAIAALNPDMIIVGGRLGRVYDSLSTIAPTLLLGVNTADYWPSFEKNVRTIASLHGKEQVAEQKLTDLKRKRDLVRKKTANDQNKAFVVMHVRGGHTAYGKASRFGFPHDVLGLVEATTLDAKGHTGHRFQMGDGLVQKADPDYIFLIDRDSAVGAGERKPTDELLSDELKQTKAYKNNKIVDLPGNIWYISGGGLYSVDKQITDIGEQLYKIKF